MATQAGNAQEKKTSHLWYDIAEWEEGNIAISTLETRWRHLWENVPDFILEINAKGEILLINKVLPEHNIEEVIGSSVYEYVPDHQHGALRIAIEIAMDTREMHQYEIPTFTGGRTTWWTNRIVPLVHNDTIVTMLIIATNVTSLKEKEQELQVQNLELKKLNRELKKHQKKLKSLQDENIKLKKRK
jgi:PAS domain S-box-containing protein